MVVPPPDPRKPNKLSAQFSSPGSQTGRPRLLLPRLVEAEAARLLQASVAVAAGRPCSTTTRSVCARSRRSRSRRGLRAPSRQARASIWHCTLGGKAATSVACRVAGASLLAPLAVRAGGVAHRRGRRQGHHPPLSARARLAGDLPPPPPPRPHGPTRSAAPRRAAPHAALRRTS